MGRSLLGSRSRKGLGAVLVAGLLVASAVWYVMGYLGPGGSSDASSGPGAAEPSARALEVHREAVVVDLHMDPLLWNRDLLVRSTKGDIDLPRMKEGGLDVGVFGIVTAGLPIIGGWKIFTWWEGWKAEARKSPWTAAVDQMDRFDALIAGSKGQVVLAKTASDIEAAVSHGQIAALLGVEGAHAIDGEVSRISILRQRGVIYMGPVHLSGNDLGGSSFRWGNRGGLSDYGRKVVREIEATGMFIDTAHLSEAAFWDVVKMTKGPLLCSHTGIYAVEPSWRNLKDDQLKAIADRGGVIGIMLATNFLGDKHIRRWVDHVKHAVQVAGIDHVGLGSDFDGFIPVPVDARDISALPRLTAALLESGFSETDVKKIMGGNFLDMMRRFRP